MGEYTMQGMTFADGVYAASIGPGSRAVVGAIGNGASGTVIGHTKRSGSSDEVVVGAIGDDANGTVITSDTDGNVIGAIGESANGTVIIEN